MPDRPVVLLESVFQHVDGRCVLDGIDLRVAVGERLLIAGMNGAGKSLLTRVLLGLDRPSAGRVEVFGAPIAERSRRARPRMGAVLQGGGLLHDLTVLENILLPLRAAPLDGVALARAARLIMTQLQLDAMDNYYPRALSVGQRRRVELARALIGQPELLIWDGLSDGLDPPALDDIGAWLALEQQRRALTIIATDQSATIWSEQPHRLLILADGRLRSDAPARDLA